MHVTNSKKEKLFVEQLRYIMHMIDINDPYIKYTHTTTNTYLEAFQDNINWLFSLHLNLVVTAYFWLRSKQIIQKTAQRQTKQEESHQRVGRERCITHKTVMSVPSLLYSKVLPQQWSLGIRTQTACVGF